MSALKSIFVLLIFSIVYVKSAPSEESSKSRSARSVCDCECGVSNRQMRVVGGNISKIHEFPWLAGLSKGGEFLCGASLITRKHVITAAHCVNSFDKRDLSIILADHDRKSPSRFSSIIVRGIKRVHLHDAFDIYSFNNDIAILELDDPVDFNAMVQPICLPEELVDYTGRTALVAGWGRTEENSTPSHILRKVAVPVWSKEDCYNSKYGHRKITGNMFCAGYIEGQKDACQGDSGGPLHLSNEVGDMEIIGVVSWGRGCARPNLPGVYTNVANYLDWIHDTLDGECVCKKSR